MLLENLYFIFALEFGFLFQEGGRVLYFQYWMSNIWIGNKKNSISEISGHSDFYDWFYIFSRFISRAINILSHGWGTASVPSWISDHQDYLCQVERGVFHNQYSCTLYIVICTYFMDIWSSRLSLPGREGCFS